jgi:hypothetical protein
MAEVGITNAGGRSAEHTVRSVATVSEETWARWCCSNATAGKRLNRTKKSGQIADAVEYAESLKRSTLSCLTSGSVSAQWMLQVYTF